MQYIPNKGHSPTLIHAPLYNVPYSRKHLREKTFAFFAVSELSAKVFSAKFYGRGDPQYARCVYVGGVRMRKGHNYIIIGLEQSRFVLKHESFLPRKFSAIR